jgi:hypothetical protein
MSRKQKKDRHINGIQPRGTVERSTTPRSGYVRFGEPVVEILAWCPDAEAKAPPEQVHFVLHYPATMDVPPVLVRFKSPDTLGFIIEELIKYRRVVWPDSQPVTGETGELT